MARVINPCVDGERGLDSSSVRPMKEMGDCEKKRPGGTSARFPHFAVINGNQGENTAAERMARGYKTQGYCMGCVSEGIIREGNNKVLKDEKKKKKCG